MGTRGRQIIGMDVEELLRLLNAAYTSEWLAYHQYWLGAKVIKGPMKDAVAAELNLHATEELNTRCCWSIASSAGWRAVSAEEVVRPQSVPIRCPG
jgi:hypothetical protein